MYTTKDFYTIRDIKRLTEAKKESKPVLGDKVQSTNQSNSKKATKDIMNDVDSTVKGIRTKKEIKDSDLNSDLNLSLLDLRYAYDPGKGYKARIKSQVKGYPSVQNEKSTDSTKEESLDYEGNAKFYDKQAKKSKELSKKRTTIHHAGLKSHNLPKEEFEPKTVFNENKIKRLNFKNTVFLSESQMLNKIPEDYKKEGNKFIMQDSNGLEYMVECVRDEQFNYLKFNILNKMNRKELNEQFKRMKELYNYNSSEHTRNYTDNSTMSELLESVRKIKK